jgi:hypothetical protein
MAYDLNERLKRYLDDRDDDKKAGRTLIHLFDALGDMHATQVQHGERITALEARKFSSGKPPKPLASIVEPNDDDNTSIRNFKAGPLRDAIRATEFLTNFWKVLVALAVLGAAFATIYSAVKH